MSQERNDEVCFLHTYKHQNFLQVGIIILAVHSHACPKSPNKKFAYPCNIFRKTWVEVDFLPAAEHQNFSIKSFS